MHVDVPLLDRIYVSPRQARDLLGGISHRHFYDLVNRGALRIVKSGRKSLVPTTAVVEYSEKIEAARASTEAA